MKKKKDSIHKEFEKYMKDEMDDLEKEQYIKNLKVFLLTLLVLFHQTSLKYHL